MRGRNSRNRCTGFSRTYWSISGRGSVSIRWRHGSFSIKAVLPTVAPHLDSAELGEVQDGTAAQSAFEEIIDPESSEERKEELEISLREYCRLDTLAMVETVLYFSQPG